MPGITRIDITNVTSGRGAYRFDDSKAMRPAANLLYASIFESLNMPLLPGAKDIKCTLAERQARTDFELGIDVFLGFPSGHKATMQEKFLFTTYNTVTVEYMQDWRNDIPGDWFNLKCQYYFVGYAVKEKLRFTNWLLLDWLKMMVATSQGRIPWETQINKSDGARASFRHIHFDTVPDDCIVATSHHYPWWCDPRPGPCHYCGSNSYQRDTRSSRYICNKCGLFVAAPASK